MKKIRRDHYVHAIGAISGSKYCSKENYEGKCKGFNRKFSYHQCYIMKIELKA